MDLIFPIAVAILLVLFLATNFEWVATALNYVLMVGLVIVVAGAIGYGIYDILGPEISMLIAIFAVGWLIVTRVGHAIAGLIKRAGVDDRSGRVKRI